jgi:glycerol uptake facilitator protein
MTPFVAEVLGSMILILLGCGVCANVNLKDTLGNNGGWLLINFAWGLAVFCGVIVAGPVSGAHLNPAVTVGLAVTGKFPWADVGPYIIAQCIGGVLGILLLWISYFDHFKRTTDLDAKLGTFSTGPAISNPIINFAAEAIATFMLVFIILYIAGPTFSSSGMGDVNIGLGSVGALPVALLVVVIGMALGGTTGYSINPMRDFIPRVMHTMLPIGEKRDSNWGYSWVPTIGPFTGGAVAGLLFTML